VHYPDGTRTASDAAAAVGCDVAQIVKSLVLTGPDGPVLALTAGHHRVDLDRLASVVGGEVRMATPDEVRAATGFAIGGTPPFGHPAPIPTVLDPSLLEHETVYAAAGTPATCFPIAPDRLRDATASTVAHFTADDPG
jgi:prolyl-tRNA editing enzyme YbaK/EbsC (Cys-tRNA(Pro) deacylase)